MTWRGTCELALGAWGRLFLIQPSSSVCCFSILKWLEKWVNSAFRKTPLFKNCRSERLSLLFISKIEIYNPLSVVDFGLPFLPCASQNCHFCTQCGYSYILLKETKRFVHKSSSMENIPVQSCPIFYRTTLILDLSQGKVIQGSCELLRHLHLFISSPEVNQIIELRDVRMLWRAIQWSWAVRMPFVKCMPCWSRRVSASETHWSSVHSQILVKQECAASQPELTKKVVCLTHTLSKSNSNFLLRSTSKAFSKHLRSIWWRTLTTFLLITLQIVKCGWSWWIDAVLSCCQQLGEYLSRRETWWPISSVWAICSESMGTLIVWSESLWL